MVKLNIGIKIIVTLDLSKINFFNNGLVIELNIIFRYEFKFDCIRLMLLSLNEYTKDYHLITKEISDSLAACFIEFNSHQHCFCFHKFETILTTWIELFNL